VRGAQVDPQLVGMCVMATSAGGRPRAIIASSAATSISPSGASGTTSVTAPVRLPTCARRPHGWRDEAAGAARAKVSDDLGCMPSAFSPA